MLVDGRGDTGAGSGCVRAAGTTDRSGERRHDVGRDQGDPGIGASADVTLAAPHGCSGRLATAVRNWGRCATLEHWRSGDRIGQAPRHRTPIFSGSLRPLIFSPYWDVPPSILRKEIRPKAYRDRGFLARDDVEVVSNSGTVLGTSLRALNAAAAGRARIRQRPAVKNALGGVKFVFPKRFNVYMHDTPTRKLFARPRRDASHECIKLQEPARLAALLLRDQPTWDSAAIASAMSAGTPRQVNLTRPVTVYIVYATVVAHEDGSLLFFDDIYGHDRALAALLRHGYPYGRSARSRLAIETNVRGT